jgi:hypothetical protein
MKDMAMICSVKEARDALKSDLDNMICMDRDFGCWIRKGIRDSAGVMIADGEKVAEISIDVFDALSEAMGHAYSSEFFQLP